MLQRVNSLSPHMWIRKRTSMSLKFVIVLAVADLASSFTTIPCKYSSIHANSYVRSNRLPSVIMSGHEITRRTILSTPLVLPGIVPLVFTEPEPAVAADQGPVVVLGAGRATGKECVNALLRRGMAVRAVARSPVTSKGTEVVYEGADSSLLSQLYADVTKPETLEPVIKGARGVIFAASSSKKGGNPELVDYQGLVNTAKLCIEGGVEHLVVVSSGGVSKPKSSIYQLLNTFGPQKIMEWKIKGEDAVRELYASPSTPASLGYTIVRPGGLTEGPPTSPSSIELNQGDEWSGRIARADVGEICAESLLYPSTRRVTLEAYYADTRKPLQEVGLSNILKLKSDASEARRSSRECRGASWGELFSGLRRDTQIKQQG